VNGYSDAEMNYFKEFERNNAHLMIKFSKVRGILNASKNLGLDHIEANSAIIINKWYARFHGIGYSRI
jgi:hypothetical protein